MGEGEGGDHDVACSHKVTKRPQPVQCSYTSASSRTASGNPPSSTCTWCSDGEVPHGGVWMEAALPTRGFTPGSCAFYVRQTTPRALLMNPFGGSTGGGGPSYESDAPVARESSAHVRRRTGGRAGGRPRPFEYGRLTSELRLIRGCLDRC